eukprot:8301051-Ditylum_brightwellii.AAC.1
MNQATTFYAQQSHSTTSTYCRQQPRASHQATMPAMTSTAFRQDRSPSYIVVWQGGKEDVGSQH